MKVTGCRLYLMIRIKAEGIVYNRTMQVMKRKIQHNAVNNQEDEDSCAYPICFPGTAPVDKKEDKPTENSSGHLSNEAPGSENKLTDRME